MACSKCTGGRPRSLVFGNVPRSGASPSATPPLNVKGSITAEDLKKQALRRQALNEAFGDKNAK